MTRAPYCAGDVLVWYGDPVLLLSDQQGDTARVTYLRIGEGIARVRKPFEVIERFERVDQKNPWTGDLTDSELALVAMIKLGIQPVIEGGFVRWP